MAQTHREPPPHETAAERDRRLAREEEERRQTAQREEEEARTEAEAKTAHLPRQGEAVRPPLSAAEAFPDEPTVKMQFPQPVTLTLEGFRMVRFEAGVQDVPASLVEHQYLADNGVTKVNQREARHERDKD